MSGIRPNVTNVATLYKNPLTLAFMSLFQILAFSHSIIPKIRNYHPIHD